ncbi:MAG: ATP-NAD kinase family protein [Lachnospiraceae bacterium]|nr:ATP-NAD kinase family protein [Lachnospiraceae bacterium]
MHRIGLIINPIAGMGGKTALKGTDGSALSRARAMGARPEAGEKAEKALALLKPREGEFLILTAAGAMGEAVCEKLALPHEIVYTPAGDETSAADTAACARKLEEAGIEILLFAGGDGTARDLCGVLGERVPVTGIPAGVKIQSAVFALSPQEAGKTILDVMTGASGAFVRREVVDLDEDAYRDGHVAASLYGTMRVPDVPGRLQSMKQGGFSSEEEQMAGIAACLEEQLEPDVFYAVGSGSCAKCLPARLGIPYELLGVDIIRNGETVEKDVTEETLYTYAARGGMKIIVSPIGGQGFLFGRGNHQFSARVLAATGRDNVIVIAPEAKILSVPGHTLHADCGDETVNETLRGYYKVLSGYGRYQMLKCI